MSDELEEILEREDALMPLSHDAQTLLSQLALEKSANPGNFPSFWEMDENDIEEPTAEEIQRDPKLRVLWAAETGELRALEELLIADPALVHARDSDGYTPLHRAAYEGQLLVIRKLLAAGADVEARTNDGWTALHSAAVWGQHQACQLLLERGGADVNAQTHGLQTPLHLAASNTHAQSEKTLQVLLMHPRADYGLCNKLGETAHTVARRCSKFAHLFDMCLPSVNQLVPSTEQRKVSESQHATRTSDNQTDACISIENQVNTSDKDNETDACQSSDKQAGTCQTGDNQAGTCQSSVNQKDSQTDTCHSNGDQADMNQLSDKRAGTFLDQTNT